MNETHHLAVIATDSRIRDRTFENDTLLGPAVISLIRDVDLDDSVFDADADMLFIEIPPGRQVVGIIGLENVTFQGCEFKNVAVAATPEDVARFKANFQVRP